VWPSPWQDTLPDWIKPAIIMERLAEHMKIFNGDRPAGTDAEVLAYMYPRTMEDPLDTNWTEIYLYVTARVMSQHQQTEVPMDIKVESLRDDQIRDLRYLKEWIYQRRLKARKLRRSKERAKALEEVKAKAPNQLGLFV